MRYRERERERERNKKTNLCKRRHRNNERRELCERERRRDIGEMQHLIDFIGHNHNLMLVSELCELVATRERERPTTRVVVGWDRVENTGLVFDY